MVRDIYRYHTVDHMSIGAIVHTLNERAVPTRKGGARWGRSVVWAILRNPAYKGKASYGKTRTAPRQRVTRPIRQRGGIAKRNSANHERPRKEWIEIPVPPIISETTFALAGEKLAQNKLWSKRHTRTPSLLQGLVSCSKCGYAYYRTSTRTSTRKIFYLRCLGSDAWRHFNGPVCDNRPVRQDLLDEVVWTEVIRLREDPALIEVEIARRLETARQSDPTQRREQELDRNLARIRKAIDRLLQAYQEDSITIDELRARMPALRRQEKAVDVEWQSVIDQAREKEVWLKLTETLTSFLALLRESAKTMDIAERQRIVRLLVKDILVGDDAITIRHSIPIPKTPQKNGQTGSGLDSGKNKTGNYLLRSGSNHAVAVEPAVHCRAFDAVNWLVAEYRQKLAREHVIDAATRRRLVPGMAFHLPGIRYEVSKRRHRIGPVGLFHFSVLVGLSVTAPCTGLLDTHQIHSSERMAP